MKKLRFSLIFILWFGFSLAPAYAAGLVPDCDFFGCDLNAATKLIDNLLQWMVLISVPLTSLVIAYAGIQMVLSADNPGKRESAKKMLKTAGWGLVLVLAGYVIVKTILDFFVVSPYNPGLK
jgi:hypothetical protein